jgi:membrane-associated phospholipid phosphatase
VKFAAKCVMLVMSLAVPFVAPAQVAIPPTQSPGSAPSQTTLPTAGRSISWKQLPSNIANDQKRIWLFPTNLTQKQTWIPTAAVVGTTAALVALDPTEGAYFRKTSSFDGFNQVFTGNATAIGTIVAPVSLYAAGLLRHDPKMQGTALLAGEAVADAEIVGLVLKSATLRTRPERIPPDGNFSDTWFESGGTFLKDSGSFPSGHGIAAFAIATVVARRYGNHRWVPFVAYGAAALVGFSRVSSAAHFASDTFMGAALGYSIARFTVLQQ